MKRFFTKQLLFLFFCWLYTSNSAMAQYIEVNTDYSVEELIKDIFLGARNSTCIEIENIRISGWDGPEGKSYGYFSRGTSTFELSEGIILSTGLAKDAKGPNSSLQDFYPKDGSWRGDQDLIDVLDMYGLPSDYILNATFLEFDFVSHLTERISFDYIFLSEEYREENTKYSDAFAFLIKKADSTEPYQNIALIPGTNIPVTSLSINHIHHSNYFGGFNGVHMPTNFNGQTKILKATTKVEKGIKYHIKLVIADHGDRLGRYDSAVMLKAGSFVGNIDLGDDLLVENNTALCRGNSHTIDATVADAVVYRWYKNNEELIGQNEPKLEVNEAGMYEVFIELSNGCTVAGKVIVEEYPTAKITENEFFFCDDNFDDVISIQLHDLTERIIEDFYPIYDAKFYLNQHDAELNSKNEISTVELNSSEPEKKIYLRTQTKDCPATIHEISLMMDKKSTFSSNTLLSFCDDDLDGKVEVYLPDFITQDYEYALFYLTAEEAEKNQNAIANAYTLTSSVDLYVRFKESNKCPTIEKISLEFKQPNTSTLLDEVTICKGTTTNLDAGEGFDSYLWSTGETTSTIYGVSVGKYWVKLGSNGCEYLQFVEVKEAEDIVIEKIEIQNQTITIYASGGVPPYEYALDNGNYQTSNSFHQVEVGSHTVKVRSTVLDCHPTEKNFIMLQFQNFISPNGDGKNDVLDFSDLRSKENPSMKIFNRYGKLIFEGTSSNNFIWDGKQNGYRQETGSYWYKLEWTEPGSTQVQKISNSIILKNK